MTFRRSAPWILALVAWLVGSTAPAQPPARDQVETSVDRALAFLKLMQEKDGSWTVHGQKHVGVTALAVTAFLSAGHVPGETPDGDVTARGLKWLLGQQDAEGVFGADPGVEMYHHGITTLLLTQLVGMTDPATSDALRGRMEKAVRVVLKAQVAAPGPAQGGWRYRRDSIDADLSVTSWQVMALRGARNVGCDVPAEAMKKALRFVEQCRDPASGGYCYTPGYPPSPGCTGTALLVLELAGKDYHRSRESLQAGSFLLKRPPAATDDHFFYGAYYASQGMFQLGSNYWNAFRPALHKVLLPIQNRNGSWIESSLSSPVYGTSMAVLSLTVEYRLLPIYQRDEEPGPDRAKSAVRN